MKPTQLSLFAPSSTLLYTKRPSGVNQFGLRPETTYDFLNPTQLVNHGRSTTVNTLGSRRSPVRGDRGSSPSLDSLAVGKLIPRMLHLRRSHTSVLRPLAFCTQETAALRICMAKGQSDCEKEHLALEACLGRVAPLRDAIEQAGAEYQDWFTQNISDHYMKPFTHRPQDHKEVYAQEHMLQHRRQWGKRGLYGKHPNQLPYGASFDRKKGGNEERYPVLPANSHSGRQC